MKYRDLLQQLHDDGWQHIRTTGSHFHYKHPAKSGLVTDPAGGNLYHDVAPGTLRSISSTSGIKMNSVNYTVIIEPAGDGTFSVYVPDLPGCVSTGTTRDDAIASIREAITGHVQTLRDLGQPVPPPRSQSHVVAA